eukprot:3974171-Prymnesium_polylepis.1
MDGTRDAPRRAGQRCLAVSRRPQFEGWVKFRGKAFPHGQPLRSTDRSMGLQLFHRRESNRRVEIPRVCVCVCYGPTGRGTRTGH